MIRDAVDRVLAERLAVQGLTSAPFADVVSAVRSLVCVQAQDAPLARYSLGARTGLDDAGVRAALDSGAVVRAHILRPTWHFVAADDLRWILALTSPKVVTGMAARHRRLGLGEAERAGAQRALTDVLARRTYLTRQELGARFAAEGLPSANDQVGHLLLLAELDGLICSGPLRGGAHTYALVDELIEAGRPRDRDDAIRELVRRFFAGHGPAGERDLVRWTKLTLTEIRAALADLGDELDSREVAGTTLWSAPDPPPLADAPRAFALSVFDEVYLTYPKLNFPRVDGHPRVDGAHFFGEHGGGVVICDRHDAGWFKRKDVGRDRTVVTGELATGLSAGQRAAIGTAAGGLAAFTGRALDLALA